MRLSNTVLGSIIPTLRNSDTEISQLIKKPRCFNYKKKRHKMLNCPERMKVSAIIDTSDIGNIGNIDQRKA